MFDSIFRARWGGALLVIAGLIVAAAGAVFAWQLIDLRDGPSGLQRAGMAAVTFGFLAFGTAAIVQGVLQLVRGRRSKTLLRIMVVIAVGFAVVEIIASIL